MSAFAAWSPMTDTRELPCLSGGKLAQADTAWIPFPTAFADPPPRPDPQPCPERLPKRLRRRVALHLTESWRDTVMARVALVLITGAALGSALVDGGGI
jgi:hypothetical protein